MWLSRLFTVYCSVMFILPILGPYAAANFYQRALLANALTSALRLHQRLPRFQLSRAFLAQALQEDSCHYLLYSLILVNSYPITMSIFPVFLFSVLHATTYTKKVLDSVGPSSLMFIRNLLDKLTSNQQNILKFIACNEIFLMPATVFMLFSGQGSLLLPFIYYRFLTLRYTSRRNPYCRTLFTELRILLEHFIMKPACPAFFRKMCLSSIAFISRLAPTGVWLNSIKVLFSLCFVFPPFKMWLKLWWGQTLPSTEGPVFWMSTLQPVLQLLCMFEYRWRTASNALKSHGDVSFPIFLMWPHWSGGHPSLCYVHWMQHSRHQLWSVCTGCCYFFLFMSYLFMKISYYMMKH